MQEPLLEKQKQKNRRELANPFQKLFIWWVYPTIKRAQKETLSPHMIEDLEEQEQCAKLHKKFQNIFRNETGTHALTKSLLKTFKVESILVMLILVIQILVQLTMPLLIKWTIEFIDESYKNNDMDVSRGVWLVVGIFCCRLSYTLTNGHVRQMVMKLGYNTIGVLGMDILDKSMRMSFLSNKSHSVGSVVTHMTVDAAKLQFSGMYVAAVGLLPLQMGIAIFMMFEFIGISFLAGLAVIVITIFANMSISKYLMKYTITAMMNKDARTKLATDIFQQIKFIKINAFEQYFLEKLEVLRQKEVKSIKDRLTMSSFNILSVWLSPVLILNATFAMFVILGNDLSAGNTFAIISIFQILQVPLLALPLSVNALIDTNVSLQRIQKFLKDKEIQVDCIEYDNYNTNSIQIQNGNFQWGADSKDQQQTPSKSTQVAVQIEQEKQYPEILKNINIKVEKGEFISIVGDVGSGKSSFLQALIGEMLYNNTNKPKITISGSIAYVSQTAWIQNASVKDNILFGLPFDQQKYDEAIYYACLQDDLKILIKGDQTMIGEKGVNLSGGQKARVSLARAIYSDRDIYLFDDPISAVDVHVGKFLMHECIKGYLSNKTRILVTHAINFTQFSDIIYVIDNGSIVEQGHFNELKNQPKFQVVYKKFFREGNDDEVDVKSPAKPKVEEKKEIKKVENKSVDAPKDQIDDLMLMEDRAQGAITVNTYFQYLKWNGLWVMGFIFFIMIIWIGLYMFSSIWIAMWTTGDLSPSNTLCLEIYLFAGLAQGIIAFLRTLILCLNGVNAANILHNRMIYTLIYAPICQFFERVPIGQILNRFTKDQNTLDVDLISIFSWVLIALGALIANTALNVYSSSSYILIAIAIYFVIGFYLQQLYIKASRDLFRLEAVSRSPIISYFSEAVSGLPTIRAFQKQEQFMAKHALNYDNNRKIALEQLGASVWFGILLGMSSLIVNVTAISICVFHGTSNAGFAGIILTYASTLDINVQQFVEATTWVETQMVSFERCIAYTKVQPEPHYKALVQAKLSNSHYTEPHVSDWPKHGEIQYKNYSVRYRDGLPLALKNVNFDIAAKEKIGVVGRTGAGKSTITLTLLRILEAAEGSIVIDGVDISTLSLKQIREAITMILQDATIFNGTIRENIDPLMTRTDDEIMDALNQCCLTKFVESRQGLDGKLDGSNMSVGEKQLICISRALLRKSKIVLIDEATANIDIETDHMIQQTIQKAFANCTVITIAHRINTILHCDKILVVDQGTVKEFGTTQELLSNQDSVFYSIYQEAQKEQQHQ